GVYTSEARDLARFLVRAGCSQESIGRVVSRITKLVGMSTNHAMSRRSVARALIEGGVASRIQLGLTISNDGATHKSVNYESRFVELKAPSYAKGETCSDAPKKARLISVASAISHTSESQVDGWRNEITNLADTFSHSPLAKRFGMSLDVDEFVKKLKGMHTDHANDQKKTYRIWQEWKRRHLLIIWI
ncbi:hypothetical protein P692DRAFT_20757827, partial [Suillus brevipes Sb2]